MKIDKPEDEVGPEKLRKRDELYESAIDVVVREGRGSVSLLQRTLGIGYGRAARLIDFMAEDGIVGEYNGSQAREVVISTTDWEQMQGVEPAADPQPKPRTKRSNVVLPDPNTSDGDDAGLDESQRVRSARAQDKTPVGQAATVAASDDEQDAAPVDPRIRDEFEEDEEGELEDIQDEYGDEDVQDDFDVEEEDGSEYSEDQAEEEFEYVEDEGDEDQCEEDEFEEEVAEEDEFEPIERLS